MFLVVLCTYSFIQQSFYLSAIYPQTLVRKDFLLNVFKLLLLEFLAPVFKMSLIPIESKSMLCFFLLKPLYEYNEHKEWHGQLKSMRLRLTSAGQRVSPELRSFHRLWLWLLGAGSPLHWWPALCGSRSRCRTGERSSDDQSRPLAACPKIHQYSFIAFVPLALVVLPLANWLFPTPNKNSIENCTIKKCQVSKSCHN